MVTSRPSLCAAFAAEAAVCTTVDIGDDNGDVNMSGVDPLVSTLSILRSMRKALNFIQQRYSQQLEMLVNTPACPK